MYLMSMGTVFIFRSVKFVIRTNDHNPPHVHIIRGDCEAKIEIKGRRIIRSMGYSSNDIKRIVKFMEEREDLLLEAWYEIHKKD